ncbi:hypothetical protein [Roseovarius sp. C03]|uniref:hypothetical protein n=1 Tax=Roseovarius sp. C03 TaxID=3449222 RepID=UPI003EDB9A93
MSAGEDEWDAILSPDERILWQGRPGTGLAFDMKNAKEFLPGALSMGFSIVWMRATRDGATEMQIIGLLLFLAGLYQLFFAPFFVAICDARAPSTPSPTSAHSLRSITH